MRIHRVIVCVLIIALLAFCFAGCGGQDKSGIENPGGNDDNPSVVENPEDEDKNPEDGGQNTIISVPEVLEEIPNDYYSSAQKQGTLIELYYDTYESFSYQQKTTTLRKRAIVYLPYGYSGENVYNIFYLMHGGWGNETTTLGTPDRPSSFKNVIDNAIEDDKFEPLIIVCPTYNNTSAQDSADFSLALQLNRNYHNELLNDLIPAVESRYSTFAESATTDGIVASRMYRGFGGFSMGSVATWRTFQNCLDYFSYFIPMSCGTSLDDDEIFRAAEGRDKGDYFVFLMTGTSDFAYSYDNSRAAKMRNSLYFIEATDETAGNFAYRVKEGYGHDGRAANEYTYNGLMFFGKNNTKAVADFTVNTKISDVINDKSFEDYGRLIFPANSSYYSGDTLGNLQLTWYGSLNTAHTVEIVNYMKSQALRGKQVFYDIYTDAEKAADSRKADTGLFFFRGQQNAKFAVTCAGGGWAFVGAMHDSFPHALELSKRGYNTFAIIYRPGAQTAYEDLARAISFIFQHADELGVNTDGYSVWGGSAGARMAASIGSWGVARYGGANVPKPSTVVMQYTGHTEYNPNGEPATFVTVGKNDGIANYRTMEQRINSLKAMGTATEYHAYDGLGHGFGLGIGTIAEGWLNLAIQFWEKNISLI